MEHRLFNCLVVDDEPIARKILINYIDQLPHLKLAGQCITALAAIDFLKRSPEVIDIIFLDINMPNLSGMEMLKTIKLSQPVIFTTAYSEYAVESYEINAADYLLKPFSIERFNKAVQKALEVIWAAESAATGIARDKRNIIFIKSDGKNHPVYLDEILYCEAMKNYTRVVLTNDRKLMPLIPLSKFEALLVEERVDFARIHRSFLVALKHIRAVSANSVFVEKTELPVGVHFKERFFDQIGIAGKA